MNNGEQQLNGDETGAGLNRLMWTRLMTILKPFFLSSEGWKAYLLLGLLMAFSFSINGLNIISSYLNRDLMTFLAQGDAGKSYFLAFQSAAVFLVITAFAVLFRYTEERFGLFWREWLTQYFFRSYLSRRAYSWLNSRTDIDNPDRSLVTTGIF